jgi:hypothetical protein
MFLHICTSLSQQNQGKKDTSENITDAEIVVSEVRNAELTGQHFRNGIFS